MIQSKARTHADIEQSVTEALILKDRFSDAGRLASGVQDVLQSRDVVRLEQSVKLRKEVLDAGSSTSQGQFKTQKSEGPDQTGAAVLLRDRGLVGFRQGPLHTLVLP